MELEELLDRVVDRESFVVFVRTMAAESETAAEMVAASPDKYRYASALGWENTTISDFLYCSLLYFDSSPLRCPETVPSWRMFAEFLYFGKIWE